MNKKLAVFIVALILSLAAAGLISCKTSDPVYYVTFYPQNGQPSFKMAFDENFHYPEEPVLDGFQFGGWYMNEQCSDNSRWKVPPLLVRDISLYAKWVENTSQKDEDDDDGADDDDKPTEPEEPTEPEVPADYYVYFHPQNGDPVFSIIWDQNFSLPVNISKEGFVFVGWYTSADCAEENLWVVPQNLTANVTLYAKWQQIAPQKQTFCVFFFPQNGSEMFSVEWSDDFALPQDPVRAGYTFGGWFTTPDCAGETPWTVPDGLTSHVILFAKWQKLPDRYIIFDPQNGAEPTKIKWDSSFVLPAVPTRAGYDFCGWYTEKTCPENALWIVPDADAVLESDITVYAKWTKTAPQIISVLQAYTIGYALAEGAQSTAEYRLSGVVKAISNAAQGNLTLADAQNGVTIGVVGAGSVGGVSPSVGCTITLTGTLHKSGGTVEIYCLSVQSITKGADSCDSGGDSSGGGASTVEDLSADSNYLGWNYSNVSVGSNGALRAAMKTKGCTVGLPSAGSYDCLVVPVKFADTVISQQDFSALNIAFNGTAAETGWQSVSTFYKISSYGKLNLHFDILGYNVGAKNKPFVAAKNLSGYQNEEGGASALLAEALTYLAAQKINLAHYDADGDGVLDAIYLVVPFQWNCRAELYDGSGTFQNLRAGYFAVCGLKSLTEDVSGGANIVYGQIENLKVNAASLIHKTGHLLGLDDYADFSAELGANQGLGGADMMDRFAGDHNAYSKIMLGWITPQMASAGSAAGSVTFKIDISDSNTSNDCILIPLGGSAGSGDAYFGEYLLIDLYSATGLNAMHAAQGGRLFGGAPFGARVCHVNSAVQNPFAEDGYPNFTACDNSVTGTALIRLVEADGWTTDSCENGGIWTAASDLWQTGQKLSDRYKSGTRFSAAALGFDILFVSVTDCSLTVTIEFC